MLFRRKALLAVFAAVLNGFYAHAQMNRKTWLVAGAMGFSHKAQEKNPWNETPTTNTFKVKPTLGYFITNNLAAGIQLGYAHTSEKTEASAPVPTAGYYQATITSKFTRKHNEYTAGLFAQRYWQLGGRLHLFVQGGGAFTTGITRTRINATTTQPTTPTQPAGNAPAGYPFGLIGYGGAPASGTAAIGAYSAAESTNATRRLAFSLSPGIVYLATQRLGLTLMMGEVAIHFKSTSLMGRSGNGLKLDTYGLDMGINTLQAGFQFHL